MLDLYKKEVKDGVETFKPVNINDIRINNIPITEVIQILNALDIERLYDIRVTMKNLTKIWDIYMGIAPRDEDDSQVIVCE